MSALNRKLMREAWRLRGQLLSIALVVATGVTTVVTLRGTYVSLAGSLAAFYHDYRFADVFAELTRAPNAVALRIAQIPGVAAVRTRVSELVNLDVPGLQEPAVGLVLSIPATPRQTLNDLHIVNGRWPDPGHADEVLVSESFARANALRPGSSMEGVIGGRWQRLRISGIAISPDYIGEMAPGSVFPDDRRFAIVRMNETALAAATGMQGAFNEVSVALAPDAHVAAVIADLDRLLDGYGGRGAYGRDDHPSHESVIGELEQNRVTGTAIPAIFLGVAAFLLHVVLTRLVGADREVIGVLKAFGYGGARIARHYLAFALAAVAGGALLGTAAGVVLGRSFTALYGQYFRFPDLAYRADASIILLAAGIPLLAAVTGALGAMRAVLRLPPAAAMRPESPLRFRPGLLARVRLAARLPASLRMIWRQVERRPVRSAASAIGVAFAVALLVVSMFFFDAVQHMVDVQFSQAQREDVAVYFGQPLPPRVRHDLAHLEGVTRVELFRTVPVRLSSGHRSRVTVLTGTERDGVLRRVIDEERGVLAIPHHGLLLSARLAQVLHVSTGDTLDVRLLEGRRSVHRVVVAGTVDDLFGLNAYIESDAMHALIREPRTASGAFLRAVPADGPALLAAVKRLPAVMSAYSPASLRTTFRETMDENLLISITFLVILSGVLAVGVVYNAARIALSERARELASLRVLGFTRHEIAVLLLGEQWAITLLGIPLGWIIGIGLGALVLSLFDMERYRVPMVITGGTYAWSALVAVASAALAGFLVRRRLSRLDLVRVLKTRE